MWQIFGLTITVRNFLLPMTDLCLKWPLEERRFLGAQTDEKKKKKNRVEVFIVRLKSLEKTMKTCAKPKCGLVAAKENV